MHSLRALIIIFCLIHFTLPCCANESLVIVTQRSSTLKSLSLETLKLVYLRKNLLDNAGERWIPLNFPASHPLRRSFSLALFKELPEDQEAYWNEQYFQGINPPEVMASEEAIIRFIAITPNAIGYIHKKQVDNRVKILLTLPITSYP